MSSALPLMIKLIPLYLNILLGYIAGRRLDLKGDGIARLMFYMINPLIIFNGVATIELEGSIFFLPVIIFCLSCMICLIFYRLSRRIWQDSSKNLVAFSAGSGNTGYFGLSLALMLLGDATAAIYIMAMLGITFYENSLGYYISAKGKYSPLECLKKLLLLPTTYALLLGVIVNVFAVDLPEIYTDFIGHIRGAYTVLGMMLVGLGMAALSSFKLDLKFIGLTFIAKFLAWPLLILTFIEVDVAFLGWYGRNIHEALILLSIVPMAVNTIVMATLLEYQSEKVATTVLLSTFFALIYVPLMTLFFIH